MINDDILLQYDPIPWLNGFKNFDNNDNQRESQLQDSFWQPSHSFQIKFAENYQELHPSHHPSLSQPV